MKLSLGSLHACMHACPFQAVVSTSSYEVEELISHSILGKETTYRDSR